MLWETDGGMRGGCYRRQMDGLRGGCYRIGMEGVTGNRCIRSHDISRGITARQMKMVMV